VLAGARRPALAPVEPGAQQGQRARVPERAVGPLEAQRAQAVRLALAGPEREAERAEALERAVALVREARSRTNGLLDRQ